MNLRPERPRNYPLWEGFTDQWEFAPIALARVVEKTKDRKRAIVLLEEAVRDRRLAGVVRTVLQDYDVFPIPSEPIFGTAIRPGVQRSLSWSEPRTAIRIGPAFFADATCSKFSSRDEEWEKGLFTRLGPASQILIRNQDGKVTTPAPVRHIDYGVHFYRLDVDQLVGLINSVKAQPSDVHPDWQSKARPRILGNSLNPIQRGELFSGFEAEAKAGKLRNRIGLGRGSQKLLEDLIRQRAEELSLELSDSTVRRRARELLASNNESFRRPESDGG